MKTFFAAGLIAGASAAVVARDQCCFQLTASGGVSGVVGQLGDGQNRVGGNHPAGTYCLSNGGLTDGKGRGCILTPPTTQFQCDVGASPTTGFSVGSSGQVTYNGSTQFYACPASDGMYNIYTVPVANQAKCVKITLSSGGKCAAASMPAPSMPAPSKPAPSMPQKPSTYPQPPPQKPSTYPQPPPQKPTTYPQPPPYKPTTPAPVCPAPSTVTVQAAPSTVTVTEKASCPNTQPIGVPPPGQPTTYPAPPASKPTTYPIPPPYQPSSAPQKPSSPPQQPSVAPSVAPSQPPPSKSTPPTKGSSCQTALTGAYQTPHLIVPVNSQYPTKAYGTQYNATITSSECTIFNFDIPQSYSGKSCSTVFLFPEQSQLQTSSFNFNNQGSLVFSSLSTPANQQTTWSNAPSKKSQLGSVAPKPGNSYSVSTGSCSAGTTQSIEVCGAGGISLNFFEDWNPSPIGVYIISC